MITTRSRPTARRPAAAQVMTYDEFKDFIQEDQKGDLLDGIIRIMSPATEEHEELQGFLLSILRVFTRSRNLGRVLGSRTLVRIDERNGYEPDVLFVSTDRMHIIRRLELTEVPDLAVEIVSASSRTDDQKRKFVGYEKAGVREYWIIDPERREAQFYVRSDDLLEEVLPDAEGVFHSQVVPGFYLRLEWLFADPLPVEADILNVLLGK